MAETNADPPGLDLAAVSAFLDTACPDLLTRPLRATVIAGGKSNLTYEVGDGRRTVIVRRPPLGHVLATAHDMSREYRVMGALAGTGVPVPRMYAQCADPDVTGAPFYVMEKVAGIPYRSAAELARLGARRTGAICAGMVDTLARLHEVDPNSVGLGDFGRPEGFLARQVSRWHRQLDASGAAPAGGGELHAALAARVPVESDHTVVHGDYRLDNLLIDGNDRIAAVIDWEMATLGDPLTDVALLLVYHWVTENDPNWTLGDSATAAGFPSRTEIVDRYAAASGRDLAGLTFHIGLGYFKLAVVFHGMHHRHRLGQTVGTGFDHIGASVEPLIAQGLTALRG